GAANLFQGGDVRMDLMGFFSSALARLGSRRAVRRRAAPLAVEALEDRLQPSTTTISGFVYYDANGNGLLDPGEAPIADSPIQLLNDANAVVGSTTSDANGHYEFKADATIDVTPKAQTQTVTLPATMTDFSQSRTINQFNPALGTLQSV